MLIAARVFAENNFGDTRSGGLAGPMGLFLIVLLAVATVLLIRNMNSRLRRLPDRFPQQRPGAEAAERGSEVLDLTDGVAGEESGGSAPNPAQQGTNRRSAS